MTIATGDEALAADVAAVQANAASALTAAGTALANSATALSNSVAAQASASAAAALAAVALSVPALDVVSSVTSTDTVPIGQSGSTVAVTLQTLLNPETIDLLATANPAADTDTFPSGQGSNVLLRQTLAGVWSLIASHLPDYHQPVVELTANTNLDGSTHNNRLLICSQGITITPTGTMGSGFVCDVVNVSGSNVTLGAGITTSNAGNVLPTGESARIVSATYSGGTVNFATLSAGSGGAAPATPGQVTGLAASGATSSTMTLSWSAPSSGGTPTAYTVNYQVTGAGSWTSATTSASGSPFTVTGLSASTSYEFEVIATNSGGSGAASSTVTASTGAPTAAPGAPTNLAASEATSSTMELTWGAPGSGGTVSGYSAYFKLHSGSTWSLATAGLAASATSYTVTGLASGTSYDFYVAANSAGSGSTSSSTVTASTTTIAGPNAVTALAAGTVTNFTVPLSWTAPAIDGSHGAAATYTIQYRINGSANWATAASGIATAYYTVTGLIAGLEYQFNVFGVNAAGSGSSTTATGTPGPALGSFTYWGTGGYPNAPVTHGTTGAIATFTVSSSVASASFGWSATQVDPPATFQSMTLYNGNPLVYGSYSGSMPASAGTWYGWMIFYDSGGDAVFAVIATTGQTMQNGAAITPGVTAT
jgi:hypothetical protein